MAFNTMTTTTIGTKGSDVYTANGVNDPRVALSVLLNRGCDPTNVASGLDAILAKTSEDPQMLEDAFVLLFQTRDVRGGKGIRDASQMMEKHLLADPKYQSLMLDLLDLVPEYGSWRDLKMLALESEKAPTDYTHELANRVVYLFHKQFLADEDKFEAEEGISLAAKYAPRECHKDKHEKKLAMQLARQMCGKPGEPLSASLRSYRQLVSKLNRAIDTTEIKMCGQHFAEIEPAKVPGRCLQKNTKAFLNQPSTYKGKGAPIRPSTDPDRVDCATIFGAHFGKAARGEAKLNGSKTVFPHELVKKVVGSMGHRSYSYYDEDADPSNFANLSQEEKDAVIGVWNQMVKDAKAGGGLGRSLAMCDFSGSMQSSGTNGDTPYWVSMALGLLISEVTTKEFEDVFLTFDSEPTLHQLPKGDIFTRVASISGGIAQGTSTDFQKAMDLVLQRCKQMRVRPGEEPENLIVLTDMNWDQAYSSERYSSYTGNSYRHHVKTAPWQTHVEMCRESFKRAGEDMWGEGNGWKMPTIVIWNIAATSGDFHAQADTEGVVMLSGWSPNLFKVLQTEGVVQWTPYQALRAQLDDERYDRVRERVRSFRG